MGNWLLKAAHSLETAIGMLSRAFGMVAVVILAAMMMLTVSDIFMRFFFNSPITASVEITESLMVGVAFLGFAWCAVNGAHIKVDLLVVRLPRRAQGIFDSFNSLALLGVCAVFAYQAFSESMVARRDRIESIVTGMPFYPFYLIVAFGFILMLLVMIILLVRSIAEASKR
ncbi:MAG TPA: TRAP transporter small permease [Dehalococcoidales bacterium]|nr:MAG: hypothetical protein A2Z05_02035 [Chloroflexi bacterium RBG_16_60_22]HJX12027.1 TRAP transporter small permease [Dehalococcoidales bacterium]